MSDGTVEVELQVQVLRQSTTPGTGAGVVRLQQILNTAGVGPLAEDGTFGPKTDTAVRTFQGNVGLVADGIVGPKTWAQLLDGWLL